MAYLASKRNKFTIKQDGAVDLRVELVSDASATPRIWLQCMPCGDELAEHPGRHLFECPGCGFEMTFKEVDILGAKYTAAMCDRFGLPAGYKKKGFLWRLVGLFGNRKRLPAPKS